MGGDGGVSEGVGCGEVRWGGGVWLESIVGGGIVRDSYVCWIEESGVVRV